VLITFYVAIVQAYTWRSGWMPPLAVAGVILSLKYRRLWLLAIPAGLVIAYSLATQAVSAEEYSWGTRLDAWKIVLEISKVNPLLGLGFANYYWYTPLFAIRGWAVNFNSHSQYIDLIAQVGVLGLLCFLWIFFELGRIGWKLTRDLPDGFARSYSYGVFAGLVGSLVAGFLVDWVLPFVYNIGFVGFRASVLPWIFLGALVAVEQMYLPKQDNKSGMRFP
jgi:O-antigen ligase